MATWASISETQSYTGIAVSQDHLNMAQGMVELFSDVIYNQTIDVSGAPLIGAKNLRLLKMATAYQAAWITDHPDLFTHTDIQSINQDGIFYVHQHENSYLLAPMARRAIKRLSWNRSKNMRVRPGLSRIIRKQYIQEGSSNVTYIEPGFENTPDQDNGVEWSEL